MKTPALLSGCLLLATVLASAGCAGPGVKDATVTKTDDYEYVTPLGSNIPVRVRKGQQASTTSPTATMSGDDAVNAIHGAGGQLPASKGTP